MNSSGEILFLLGLLGVFGVLLTVWLYRRKPGKTVSVPPTSHYKVDRQHYKQCLRCGYDMRGTPDRCPECGANRPGYIPLIGEDVPHRPIHPPRD
jgi:hypothetical protein